MKVCVVNYNIRWKMSIEVITKQRWKWNLRGGNDRNCLCIKHYVTYEVIVKYPAILRAWLILCTNIKVVAIHCSLDFFSSLKKLSPTGHQILWKLNDNLLMSSFRGSFLVRDVDMPAPVSLKSVMININLLRHWEGKMYLINSRKPFPACLWQC